MPQEFSHMVRRRIARFRRQAARSERKAAAAREIGKPREELRHVVEALRHKSAAEALEGVLADWGFNASAR